MERERLIKELTDKGWNLFQAESVVEIIFADRRKVLEEIRKPLEDARFQYGKEALKIIDKYLE